MKKVLIVATVIRFLEFERNDIKLLKELGYEVHCATNLEGEQKTKDIEMIRHQIDFARSPFSKQTIIAYRQLKKLMDNEQFDVVHCHTPVGGTLARIAAHRCRKKDIKVIYTAHGFHFFKGAPLKNWLIYYLVEKFLSRWTNVLITINKEDYARALKKFNAKKVEYIPGVGIDVEKYSQSVSDEEKIEIRKKYNLKQNDFVILSVGELSVRKNHQIVIKALAKINVPNIKYIICGQGDEKERLLEIAENFGVQDRVIFMGYQQNVKEFYDITDIFLFPSLQEGLPVALMEAMASGLPIICSPIRGNIDLITPNAGGYHAKTVEEYAECIEKLYLDDNLRKKDGYRNFERIKEFEIKKVSEKMLGIYQGIV